MNFHYPYITLLLHAVFHQGTLSTVVNVSHVSTTVLEHADWKNSTPTPHAEATLSRNRRSIPTRYDFYDSPPTISPGICSTSPEELQALNAVLFEALMQMMAAPSSSSQSPSCNAPSQQPPTSDCRVLINYIKTTSSRIACEGSRLKRISITSDSSYAKKEARYEEKIQKLKNVIEKLKQNKIQATAQLKSDYDSRLQLLLARVKELLQEAKRLRDIVSDKMIDIVAERIELSKYQEAVQEYKEIQMSRDLSIPRILKKVYKPGDSLTAGKIGFFLLTFPIIEEQIVAACALRDLLQTNNDLDSLSVLVLDPLLGHITGYSNFNNVIPELQSRTHTIKRDLMDKVGSVLSSVAHSVKQQVTSDLVKFAEDMSTQTFFLLYAETIMKILYENSGRSCIDYIIPLLTAFTKKSPKIACARATIKLMGTSIYSKEGLELVYVLSKWDKVIGDPKLQQKIPSELRMFDGKKCIIRNVDKEDAFLSATSKIRHSGERRLIVTYPSNWNVGNNGKWYIDSKDEGKTFQFFNVEYKEYLYAAGDYFKHDNDRRSVFTWVPGSSVNQGYWEFVPFSYGEFRILNKYHGEYLYAATGAFDYYKNWRRVFTWGKSNDNNVDQYWKIKCE